MRSLMQPGPCPPERIVSYDGRLVERGYRLEPGLTLNEALTRPLVEAGFIGATMRLAGAGLQPFAYVVPHPAPDPSHVAYFSPPRTPAGLARVELANAIFGWRDREPFVHCHGVWTEPGGARRGGHMLAHETIVAEPAEVRAWAMADATFRVEPDEETNFSLFDPLPHRAPASGRPARVARIRPNVDLCSAVETICRGLGRARATIRGSLGSLIGAVFEDGRELPDIATEILVLTGTVRPDRLGDPRARIETAVADMTGAVHTGTLARGENPVCITFELVLEFDN
ncbi:MAG: DUF296 domain-containing protein [Acetobacteraceae bacterium]|nr:DUF296 domain-containing protein [Acetobacteraceae bacterium]